MNMQFLFIMYPGRLDVEMSLNVSTSEVHARFNQICMREIISLQPKHTPSTIKGG